MRILLIEDEEYIRDLFKRQLDLSGFTTDGFEKGNEGLAALAQNQYDLVLLDIMLPDINGLQILQKIKQDPAKKNIPVMMLTNLGQDAVIKQGFELGADGYLVKAAYTPDQVVQEVKNLLAKKQAAPVVATGITAPQPPTNQATPAITPEPVAPMPPPPVQPAAPVDPLVPIPASDVTTNNN